MKDYLVEATDKTPEFRFTEDLNRIKIKGKAIPEDSLKFWRPVLTWLNEFLAEDPKSIILDVELEYFNTSSSKCILDFLRRLMVYHKANDCVKINWYYEEDDDDIREAGEDYQALIKIPFEMIEKI